MTYKVGTWKWMISFWISCTFAAACYSFAVWIGVWLHSESEWFRMAITALWRISLAAFGVLMFAALAVTSIRKLTRR
jgi:hypothetical protein